MKILFLSRATLFSNPGGDTVQITMTAKYLRKLGVLVDIRLTNESIDYATYDLIHFFNVIRPADALKHIEKTSQPYVLSTIFVDYSEFEQASSSVARRLLFRLFSADFIEYAKVIGRSIKNNEKIGSKYYLLNGHKASVQKLIAGAALLLPNSENEYRRLRTRYEIDKPYRVIPNGIDPALFTEKMDGELRDNLTILCVARFEPLKNQLRLIRALANSRYTLQLVGRPSLNHQKYYEQCKSEASSNVQFTDYVPQEQLLDHYKKAKVHVLPSWFETTGLSTLEAAASGCNIVITKKGDAFEYFGDDAYYCDPSSVDSIRQAVTAAAAADVNPALRLRVVKHFTWELAAQHTCEAYKQTLEDCQHE